MTEPLACVLHGIARSNVKPGDRVLVLGDGAIGLMFVAVLACLKEAGNLIKETSNLLFPNAEVVLFGGNDSRLEIGKKLGAFKTFNYHQVTDIPGVVKELTDGWGADVVIECTGVPAVWETAIASARPGATVNLFGGCPKDTAISVNTEKLHYSELTLKGVFHNTPKYVREALSLLATEKIPFELLVSDRRHLKDLEQVFQDMRDRKVIKVIVNS
jgi:L-iditol 2-dehydrogenase